MDKLYGIFIEHLCPFKSWKAPGCYIFYGLYENTYILSITGFGKTWGWVTDFFFKYFYFWVKYPLIIRTSYWSLNSLFKTLFCCLITVPHMTLHLYFRKCVFPFPCLSGVENIYSYCRWILGYKQESYVILSGWGLHSSLNISDMYSPLNEA